MELETLLMKYGNSETSSSCTITTGIVKANWNEDAKGMVLVETNMGENGKTDTGWIPVLQPYCGNGYGQYFLPEIGTQVVLGYLGGEVNAPIVLGCLWNPVDLLPQETAKEDNSIKKIQTKGNNRIEWNDSDGKEQIGIYTKGGIAICLQDEEKTISMQNADGKTYIRLHMESGEIEIAADKKLSVSIAGKEMIALDGSAGKITAAANSIQIKGDQSLQIKTQNAKMEGSMLELKAQSSAKVNAGGILELKGSITKING